MAYLRTVCPSFLSRPHGHRSVSVLYQPPGSTHRTNCCHLRWHLVHYLVHCHFPSTVSWLNHPNTHHHARRARRGRRALAPPFPLAAHTCRRVRPDDPRVVAL